MVSNDAIRFVNLMKGHIWLESEGLSKGCTATIIVKLGINSNVNVSKQIVPGAHPNRGIKNFSARNAFLQDQNLLISSSTRCQRSV